MSTNTYVALDKVTVGTAVSSVTFSSIPSGYTDLVLVMNTRSSSTAASDTKLYVQFNSDTATNYSQTFLVGNGTSASSSRQSSQAQIYAGDISATGSSSYAGLSTVILQIQNYSNTTTYKTMLSRVSSANVFVEAVVGLWRSTAAITSITLDLESTPQFISGSTFSLYGIAAQAVPGTAKATGGTITYDNFGNVIHTFTSSGTFTPTQSLTADILVIAGGGSGGARFGGGGGGGGVSEQTGKSIILNTSYTVTVGAGGASDSDRGASGSNSVFSAIISNGGGAGGSNRNNLNTGLVGGSGGGSAYEAGANANQGNTDGATGFGNNGGNAGEFFAGSGGGGAGAVGGNTVSGSVAGAGGAGRANSISGSSVTYSGGGGGGVNSGGTAGSGGSGGGGAGSVGTATATNGTANTGGGGGGGGYFSTSDGLGGSGGSGIVIIRYQG